MISNPDTTKTWRRWTALIIVATSGLLVCWDLLALEFGDEEATISAVVNDAAWFKPRTALGIGIVMGGLAVHFFGWSPRKGQ